MPEQKPSWIPRALLMAPLALSTPALGQDTVPVSEFTDRELLDDRVMVRGEVRGVPGLFVDVPDLEPVAKHGQDFVYFDAIAEDGVTPICFGVDHLLPISDGVWRLDLETARISSANVDCVTMLTEAGQAYDPVLVEEDLPSQPSWAKDFQLGFLLGPYTESYDIYTPGVNPDFRFTAGMPLGYSPWMIGGTTNFYMPVAEMERSGLGRVGGIVGREFKFPVADMNLFLSAQAGWSKDYNPLLDAPYAGVGATVNLADFDAIHTSLVADFLVTHDFINNGWFLAGDLGLAYTASVGLTVKPAMFLPERDERVKPAKDVVIAVEPEPKPEPIVEVDESENPLNLILDKMEDAGARYTEAYEQLNEHRNIYNIHIEPRDTMPKSLQVDPEIRSLIESFVPGETEFVLDARIDQPSHSFESGIGAVRLKYGYYLGDYEDNGRDLPASTHGTSYGRVIFTDSYKPNGSRITFESGDWIEATWSNGVPTDAGQMSYQGVHFEGRFPGGNFRSGKVTYPDGTIFIGEFDTDGMKPKTGTLLIYGEAFLYDGYQIYTSEGLVPFQIEVSGNFVINSADHGKPEKLEPMSLETVHIKYVEAWFDAANAQADFYEALSDWEDKKDEHTDELTKRYGSIHGPLRFTLNQVDSLDNDVTKEEAKEAVKRLAHFFRTREIDKEGVYEKIDQGFELIHLTLVNGSAVLTVADPEGDLIHYSAKMNEAHDYVNSGQWAVHELKSSPTDSVNTRAAIKEIDDAYTVIGPGFAGSSVIYSHMNSDARIYGEVVADVLNQLAKERYRAKRR